MDDVTITFSRDAKKEVLELIGKTVDDENFIVEKNDLKTRVLTTEGDEISLEEFGGFKKGSEVFIKNDLISLIRLSDE